MSVKENIIYIYQSFLLCLGSKLEQEYHFSWFLVCLLWCSHCKTQDKTPLILLCDFFAARKKRSLSISALQGDKRGGSCRWKVRSNQKESWYCNEVSMVFLTHQHYFTLKKKSWTWAANQEFFQMNKIINLYFPFIPLPVWTWRWHLWKLPPPPETKWTSLAFPPSLCDTRWHFSQWMSPSTFNCRSSVVRI